MCNDLMHLLLLLLGDIIQGISFFIVVCFLPTSPLLPSLQEKVSDINRANITGHLYYYDAICSGVFNSVYVWPIALYWTNWT